MAALAAKVVGAGYTAIVDAVYAREDERRAIAEVARKQGVPFRGVWLEAPADVLKERVTARRGDASDATADVVEQQARLKLGALDWRRADVTGNLDSVVRRVAEYLGT